MPNAWAAGCVLGAGEQEGRQLLEQPRRRAAPSSAPDHSDLAGTFGRGEDAEEGEEQHRAGGEAERQADHPDDGLHAGAEAEELEDRRRQLGRDPRDAPR